MTIKAEMKRRLYESGLFEKDCNAIIEEAKKVEILDSMKDRWDDEKGGYIPLVIDTIWISVKRVALEYINKNMPDAWFKSVFE